MVVTAVIGTLPPGRRRRALFGRAETITDLAVPVDPDRDHLRGPRHAAVTVVEYGDYECTHCGKAEAVVRELLADFGDVRYVWRHLPPADVHVHALLGAARVAEDVESADLSSVAGTPTFFVNGRLHQGAYDVATLSAAVRTARERAEASV